MFVGPLAFRFQSFSVAFFAQSGAPAGTLISFTRVRVADFNLFFAVQVTFCPGLGVTVFALASNVSCP